MWQNNWMSMTMCVCFTDAIFGIRRVSSLLACASGQWLCPRLSVSRWCVGPARPLHLLWLRTQPTQWVQGLSNGSALSPVLRQGVQWHFASAHASGNAQVVHEKLPLPKKMVGSSPFTGRVVRRLAQKLPWRDSNFPPVHPKIRGAAAFERVGASPVHTTGHARMFLAWATRFFQSLPTTFFVQRRHFHRCPRFPRYGPSTLLCFLKVESP